MQTEGVLGAWSGVAMGVVLFVASGAAAQVTDQPADVGTTHVARAESSDPEAATASLWASPARLNARARRVRITGRTLLYTGLVGMVAGGVVAARFYEPCPDDEDFCFDFGRPLHVAMGMSFALPLVTLGAILLGRAAWLRTRALRLRVDMDRARGRYEFAATMSF